MPRKPRRRDPQPKTAVSGDLEADASATPTLLFEKNPRTYGGRRDQLESMHAFFARYDHPTAERVRNMCQKWFERYKCNARQPDVKDLHARFLKNKDEQHYAAWFELCIHEMLARLGFSVTTHPDLPGTTHPPDFKATLAGSRAFVEATVLRRPSGGSPCVRDAAYKMLRLELENCFATITAVDGKLCRLLKRGELQREFQKRFDEAKRLYDTDGDRVPRIARIRFDDWQLTVELYPATSGRRTQGRVIPLALDEFVEPAVRHVQGKIDEKSTSTARLPSRLSSQSTCTPASSIPSIAGRRSCSTRMASGTANTFTAQPWPGSCSSHTPTTSPFRIPGPASSSTPPSTRQPSLQPSYACPTPSALTAPNTMTANPSPASWGSPECPPATPKH